MGKRIKRVFNSDQVFHLWAHQSQDGARNSSGNVFYSGTSIYSYGLHYKLGELKQYNGVTVALINNTGYSTTTSKHIRYASNAVSHMIHFETPDINAPMRDILVLRQGELMDRLFKHFNGRSFYSGYSWNESEWYANRVKDFNFYCIKLGHSELALDLNETYIELFNEHIDLCNARKAELNSPENIAKLEAKRIKKAQVDIEAWRKGSSLTQTVRSLRFNLLRVSEQEVQTSGGASVPLSHAIRLLALIERKQAKVGEKVGHFKLSQIGTDGIIQIGCHNIQLSEAKAVLAPYRNSYVELVA